MLIYYSYILYLTQDISKTLFFFKFLNSQKSLKLIMAKIIIMYIKINILNIFSLYKIFIQIRLK